MAYTDTEKIRIDSQKLNIGSPLVELYKLDATAIGGTIHYFTPMTSGGNKVTFGGIDYDPLPVEFEGVEMDSTGQMPRPKIRVGNVNKDFTAMVRESNQLVGCTVTRRRTFQKYLDFGSDPSPSAMFPEDKFVVERMTRMDKKVIEWELKAPFDLEGVFIPRRLVLDLCDHVYRIYDSETGNFSYDPELITCPYAVEGAGAYFDLEGKGCSKAEDKCGKKLVDCQLRYGTLNQLPYRGFPGVGKIGYPYR